jgi:RNA polymerase sigma-70 factor (ECF subfamily)
MDATTRSGEAELVRRAVAGDLDAFTRLVRRHDVALRALAFRMLGTRERMEDALQDAYVRAFRSLPGFRGDSLVSTWLYRLVYTGCVDELRRTRRQSDAVAADPPVELDVSEQVAQRLDLERALAGLPVEERAAVLLVDGHGLDYAGAAEVLGVPVGTIASRLNRARSTLRAALAGEQREEAVV